MKTAHKPPTLCAPNKKQMYLKKKSYTICHLILLYPKALFYFLLFQTHLRKKRALVPNLKKKTNTRSYSYELLTTNTHENVLCSYCRLSLGAVIPLRFIVDVLLPLQFSLSIGKVELNSL